MRSGESQAFTTYYKYTKKTCEMARIHAKNRSASKSLLHFATLTQNQTPSDRLADWRRADCVAQTGKL
jgi:hypothetical protein